MDIKTLLALDNMALILQAQQLGMTVHPEDLLLNYAEMDHELTTREDQMVSLATSQIQERVKAWLEGIASADDIDLNKSGLEEILHQQTLDHIKSVWIYGNQTAEQELLAMGAHVETFASGGIPDKTPENLTNDDAYEWYDRYTLALSRSGSDALFIKMQPLILEALDRGLVRQTLAQTLTDEFTRYGSVRADIIARTESNKAFNWGRRWRFDESAALGGYRYSAILDGRTTQMCRGLHDQSWSAGDPDLDNYTPPNHYRCRSILVPISKYKDWTFKGPDPGWMDELPDKERVVLEKFMDSSFYPTRTNVKVMETPLTGSTKPEIKKQKAKAAAAAPAKVEEIIKAAAAPPAAAGSRLTNLTAADKEAAARVAELIGGEDYSDKMAFAEKIISKAGLDSDGLVISHKAMSGSNGYVRRMVDHDDRIVPKEFSILQDADDPRPHEQKIRTVLHEFYHLNYKGLVIDQHKFAAKSWSMMEETATELSAHYMAKNVLGITKELAASYEEYLIKNLPKLKQLDDFKESKTLAEFGEKFIKYRFSSEKTAEWETLYTEMIGKRVKKGYYERYETYVSEHMDEMLGLITEKLSQKNAREPKIQSYIRRTLEAALKPGGDKKDFAYQSAIVQAMDRLGVD